MNNEELKLKNSREITPNLKRVPSIQHQESRIKHRQQPQQSIISGASFSPSGNKQPPKTKPAKKQRLLLSLITRNRIFDHFQLQESCLTTFAATCAPAGQTAEHLFVLDLFLSFSIKGKRKKQATNSYKKYIVKNE